MRAEEQQSRVFYELSSMIVHILRSPPLSLPSSVGTATSSSSSSTSRQPSPSPTQMPAPSPTAFASLFLGISLALMLFGSVTFAIGFVLMPLVMALVVFFYAVEILFHLSQFGRSIFFPPSSRRDLPSLWVSFLFFSFLFFPPLIYLIFFPCLIKDNYEANSSYNPAAFHEYDAHVY